MVYFADGELWKGEDDMIIEMSRPSSRSDTRRERIYGLGIKGLDASSSKASPDDEVQSLKKNALKRRSLVSFITKSAEPPSIRKFGSARPSTSRSNQSSSPTPSASSQAGWRASNPSPTLGADSSTEDLTTYHTNLARFQAERAERAAELGLPSYDLCRTDSPGLQILQLRDDQIRKSSGLGVSRGLRGYWGGSSSAEAKHNKSPSKSSNPVDLYWDERSDQAALKEWWDNLGN